MCPILFVIQKETMCGVAQADELSEWCLVALQKFAVKSNWHRLLVNRFLLKDNERKEKKQQCLSSRRKLCV